MPFDQRGIRADDSSMSREKNRFGMVEPGAKAYLI